jgi:rod shape-determining protein MreC
LSKNIFEFKEYLILAILLIVSLALLPFNDDPQVKNLRTYAFGIFGFATEATQDVLNIFRPEEELEREKKINGKLSLQVNLLREYGIENIQLKRMLSYYDTSKYSLVTAKVVSRNISRVNSNLILNRGKKDGITEAMPVIDEFGLAGIVTDVSRNFSLVRTIENSKLKIAVTDQRSRISGIAAWGGSKLVLKNIPASADVSPGDRIITSEFSSVFPPSIPVGVVVKKEININGLLGSVFVKPFTEFEKENFLFIVKLIQNKQIDSLKLNLFLKR